MALLSSGTGVWFVTPGASVTGATSFDPEQPRRQIRVLRDAIPGLTHLAILGDADVPPILADLTLAAAITEGLRPVLRLLRGPEEITTAVAAFRNSGAQALVVLEVPRTSTHGTEIVDAATDAGLPTLLGRDMARACPLIACGTSFAAAARRASGQINLLLMGTDIAVLPIERVAQFEVVLNLETAGRLGHYLPSEAFESATQVVDTAISR